MPGTSAKVRYEPVLKLPPVFVDGNGPRRKIIDGNYRKRIANELGYACPEIVTAGLRTRSTTWQGQA